MGRGMERGGGRGEKEKLKELGGALVNGYSRCCAPKQFTSKTNDLRGSPNELRTIAGRRARSGLRYLLSRAVAASGKLTHSCLTPSEINPPRD